MMRRNGLVAATLSLASLGSCIQAPDLFEEAQRPNIVVILLDDLGYSDIGAFGGEIRTPAIDALASEGRAFSQFYVHPRCSPTRASLMTGMYPHQAGLGLLAMPEDAGMPPGPYQGYLDPELPTLAQELGAVGYSTYMSGKWHLGEAPEYWPRNFGFDRYFGLISGASSYYEIIEDQPRVRRMALDDDAWMPPDTGFFMTDATTEFAIEFLEGHFDSASDDPFFLYVAYTAPHWPLHADQKDIDAYAGTYDVGWDAIVEARAEKLTATGASAGFDLSFTEQTLGSWQDSTEQAAWIENMKVHAAMVTAADRGIGEITKALERAGHLEDTLILILSDNGASAEDVASRGLHDPSKKVGERGSYLSFGEPGATVANAPLNDFKGSVHEGGIRSPLIAHWPGLIVAGEWDHASVFGVMDLPSSILAIADATAPPTMEGEDLSEVLMGKASVSRPLYWEHVGWRGVRDGALKAVSAPGEDEWQLYDLSVDPSEVNDIARQRSSDVARLASDWETWSSRIGAEPIPMETLMQLYGGSEQ